MDYNNEYNGNSFFERLEGYTIFTSEYYLLIFITKDLHGVYG